MKITTSSVKYANSRYFDKYNDINKKWQAAAWSTQTAESDRKFPLTENKQTGVIDLRTPEIS